jgi:hypothetical protein
MAKVWNITGGPGSESPPTVLMLLGKRVLPGRYTKVEASQLKNAHKIKKDVEAGLVFIGDKLPESHAAPVHARLPVGHARSHGEQAEVGKPLVPKFRKPMTEKSADGVEERGEGKNKKNR